MKRAKDPAIRAADMLASEMLAAPVLNGMEGVAEAVELADEELDERT